MSAPPQPQTLVVPTRGRLAETQDTLLGFDHEAQRFGRSLRFIVADDAPVPTPFAWDPSLRSRLVHLDARTRAAATQALVDAGCDRDLLEFAVGDPLQLGLTPGANRNFVQLVSPDRVVLTVDDDIVARLYRPPEVGTEVEVRGDDASEFWFFRDAAHARTFVAPDADVIAAMMAGLSIVPGPALPPVCASWLGMSGDPGSPNGLYWLVQRGDSRARLMDDYPCMRRSGRMMRSVRRPSITFGAGWTPAIVAYDHARLVPPFLPVLRGQGLAWGATIAGGGAWSLARIPGALEHRLDEVRATDASLSLTSMSSLAVAAFVQMALTTSRPPSANTTAAEGLARVADRLADVSRTREVFDAFAEGLVVSRSDGLIRMLQGLLDTHGGQPAAWADDVQAAIAAVARVREGVEHWAPYDIAHRPEPRALLRTIVARFARLLREWPDIIAAARTVDPASLQPARA